MDVRSILPINQGNCCHPKNTSNEVNGEPKTFQEFWEKEYLPKHSQWGTRAVHFAGPIIGTAGGIGSAITFQEALLALASIPLTYAILFPSHWFIEKNQPATFKHPLWSIGGEFKMWWYIATGKAGKELERLGITKKEEPTYS